MRCHYKTDFHRFNLKRAQAGLLPITEEIFNEKVTSLKESRNQKPNKGIHHIKENKKQQHQRKLDAKKKQSNQPFHAETIGKTIDEQIDEQIAQSPKLSLLDSLFDRKVSKNFERNLEYMTKKYGFYIPCVEKVEDIHGLIKYLGEKLSLGNTCIYCDKTFHSLEAVRAHMRDTLHFKMQWEFKEEYEEFYSFDDTEYNEEDTVENDSVYVSESHELVLVDANKIIGNRAFRLYYRQKPTNSQRQLMTSLMQEHKRLESVEHQKRVNMSHGNLRKQQKTSLKFGMKGNYQLHYRAQNPI
jgi:pre-60S factor REI1